MNYKAAHPKLLILNYNYYLSFVKPVSYTHLRAHETVLDLVCRLLLEKKKQPISKSFSIQHTEIKNTYICTSSYYLLVK